MTEKFPMKLFLFWLIVEKLQIKSREVIQALQCVIFVSRNDVLFLVLGINPKINLN